MKILLLEDDVILNEIIDEFLESLGYRVDTTFNGLEAIEAVKKIRYDLFLLDVGVPKIDGFELLKYIREIDINTPAIFITSLNSVKDLEKGFGVGCDDYIKKPFDLKELELRIEKIKKTHHIEEKNQVKLTNDISYDYTTKTITIDQKSHPISLKESEVLEYFIKNKNRLLSLDEIIANVWLGEELPSYATLRTYVKNLRKILPKEMIKTIKGLGYKFEI